MPALCKDCKHATEVVSRPYGEWICAGPQLINLVDGRQMTQDAHEARYFGPCGRDGKFYEPAVSGKDGK